MSGWSAPSLKFMEIIGLLLSKKLKELSEEPLPNGWVLPAFDCTSTETNVNCVTRPGSWPEEGGSKVEEYETLLADKPPCVIGWALRDDGIDDKVEERKMVFIVSSVCKTEAEEKEAEQWIVEHSAGFQ